MCPTTGMFILALFAVVLSCGQPKCLSEDTSESITVRPHVENRARNGGLMRLHGQSCKADCWMNRAVQDNMYSRTPFGFQEMHGNYNLSSRDSYKCKCIVRGVEERWPDALAGRRQVGRVTPGTRASAAVFEMFTKRMYSRISKSLKWFF